MWYLSFAPTASSAACNRVDKLAAAAKAKLPLVTFRRAERREICGFMGEIYACCHPMARIILRGARTVSVRSSWKANAEGKSDDPTTFEAAADGYHPRS